jgi:hypothetical protein
MKKLTALYFALTASLVFGQFIDLGQKGFGGTGNDYLKRFVDTNLNVNYLFGYSNSNASFDKGEDPRGGNDFWIVKTDATNNFLWDKTIGGSLDDLGSDLFIKDNILYCLGSSKSSVSGEKTMSSFGGSDGWLVALDTNGNILWQKQYGGTQDDYLSKILALPNGNLLLAGISKSDPSSQIGNKTSPKVGGFDFWLVEINPLNGAILNQKSIGSVNDERFNNVYLTPTNKIIIKGGANSGVSGDKTDPGFGAKNMWIVMLDQNYTKLTDKCFGSGGESGTFGGLAITNDAYYFVEASASGIAGNKTAPNRGCLNNLYCFDYWVIKTDPYLNIIWDQSYGGNKDEFPFSIENGSWNKLIVSGSSNSTLSGNKTHSNYGASDVWFLVLNESNGNIVSQKSYGGYSDDEGSVKIKRNDPSKLLIEANSQSTFSGNKTVYSKGSFDFWMVELNASNYLTSEEINSDNTKINVYPNPYSGQVNFKLEELKEAVTLKITTLDGKIIHTQTIQPSNESIELKLHAPSEQFLFYSIKGDHINFTGKVIGL